MTATPTSEPGTTETLEAEAGIRWGLPVLVASLIALYLISRYDYAVFHTLVELYSMIVAASVFLVTFHVRRLLENHYLLLLGIAFLFFVVLGIPHVLAFQGLQLLPGFDNDLPTQAFIAQRFILATSFLIAPAFLGRRLHTGRTIAVYGTITAVTLMSLLVWRNFPAMFVDGFGLTPLKLWLEVVLSAMFVTAGVLLSKHRAKFEPTMLKWLFISLGCFVGSEVSFMLYATPGGLSNLVGHLFQVAAFFFMYQAMVVTALVNPFALLFRELSERETSLVEANARLRAVASISDTAISTLNFDELVTDLLERLRNIMDADIAVLFLAERGHLRPVASSGIDAELTDEFSMPIGTGFAGGIAQARHAGFVFDAQTEPHVLQITRNQGIRSMIGAPLIIGDELLGVMHVDWRTLRPQIEDDLPLLQLVADRVALALRNARLYENEHRVAEVLQDALLSLPDHLEGVRFASKYRSAVQAARVGGDFYDMFELEHARVGVVVGDVSGKGLDAAVLTSLVTNTIRALSMGGDTSPAQIMHMTNRVIGGASDPETFVTVFFAVLDRAESCLVYCNAGHTAGAIVRSGGVVEALTANSPIAGAFADSVFSEAKVCLQTGETLVLYTDGLTEARRNDEQYGEERLFGLLAREGATDPDDVVAALFDDVMTFTEGELADDVAVLAVQPLQTTIAT